MQGLSLLSFTASGGRACRAHAANTGPGRAGAGRGTPGRQVSRGPSVHAERMKKTERGGRDRTGLEHYVLLKGVLAGGDGGPGLGVLVVLQGRAGQGRQGAHQNL